MSNDGRRSVRQRWCETKQLGKDDGGRSSAFAKLKVVLHAKAERTVEALWNVVGQIVTMFQPQECAHYFKSCGYDPE